RHHWLGTDLYGRDQLTRIVYAGRVDLLIALGATAAALALGTAVGAVAGYRGGVVDQLVMRSVDAVQAFPSFILAMGVAAALGHHRGGRHRDPPRPDLRAAGPRGDAAHPRDGVRRGPPHGGEPAPPHHLPPPAPQLLPADRRPGDPGHGLRHPHGGRAVLHRP